MRRPTVLHLLWCLVAASAFVGGRAQAALGESPGSVANDARALRGVLHMASRDGFDAYEILAAGGMGVREYVSSAGLVCAVSWSGPAPPDLEHLLGRYFGSYARSLAALEHPGLRRSLRIETPDGLIVETGGHLRAFSGRAYVRGLLPLGAAPPSGR